MCDIYLFARDPDTASKFADAQIHPGHAIFEKRKPALMDSLVQVGAAGLAACLESIYMIASQF